MTEPVVARAIFQSPTGFALDLRGNRVIECGAFVLATMVYPGAKALKQRKRIFQFCYRLMVQDRCARDPGWGSQVQDLIPELILIDDGRAKSTGKTIELAMQKRVKAGQMALALLQERMAGRAVKLSKTIPKLNVTVLAATVAPALRLENDGHLTQRVWRGSRPVIHLCMAAAELLAQILQRREPLSLMALFSAPGFLEELLGKAEAAERYLYEKPVLVPWADRERFYVLPPFPLAPRSTTQS